MLRGCKKMGKWLDVFDWGLRVRASNKKGYRSRYRLQPHFIIFHISFGSGP